VTVPGCLRSRDSCTHRVIEEAFGQSETIRQIGRALDATDVIVYIATSSSNCRARPTTTLLGSGDGIRYLSIVLPTTTCGSLSRPDQPIGTRGLIAWLGHELRHALEIGRDLQVRDQSAVRQLFRRIGYEVAENAGYETAAAIEVQRTIARELSKQRAR